MTLEDVPAALRARLPGEALTPQGFRDHVAALRRETERRERDGEYEHLVYFLLQSQRFTREPRIEPALSARELLGEPASSWPREPPVEGVGPRPGASDAVKRRVADFAAAVGGRPSDSRLRYFKRLLDDTQAPGLPPVDRLLAEYDRVMRFLYRKEFVASGLRDPQEREAYIASLYQDRGLSTDSQIEANFALYQALAVLRARGERRLDHVLLVGPGLDFAPRTDLVDAFEPQSYQPFALADALLALGLSDGGRLRIHCVDVNARVLDHLGGLAAGAPLRLELASGIPERDGRRFEGEYRDYFERLGGAIGEQAPPSRPLPGRLGKSLLVRPDVVRAITADRLDIVTERYDPSPSYDLVVATNVLGYFDPGQQGLALGNIDAMLRPGGYLVHNEPQTTLLVAAQALGLAMSDARSVRLASDGAAPLFDRVVIHRKAVPTRPRR